MSVESFAILTDVSKCIGCEECVAACQQANHLPPERPWRWLKKITDLSSARWTTIIKVRGERGEHFVRRQCRHCLEPACVEACIVGALRKTEQGPVIYDRDVCIGCRYCMIACPWEIPRYSWEQAVPYVQKCDMCYQRVREEGKPPACVEACPTKATIFGERSALLVEARRRIAAEPDRYLQRVWGERQVGGTSVLYVSDIDLNLTDLDAPIEDATPLPARTFKVLRHMPKVFAGMAAIMGGVYWVIERRQKLSGGSDGGGAGGEGAN
jgi:formate dehydrogenase iron-sulfur subunit